MPLGHCVLQLEQTQMACTQKAGVQRRANFLRSFNVAGDGRKRISNYWLLFTFVNEMMCARYAPSTSQARAVINYLEFLALTLAWRKKKNGGLSACSVRWALVRAFCIGNLYLAANNNLLSRRLDWWLCSLPFRFWELYGFYGGQFRTSLFSMYNEDKKVKVLGMTIIEHTQSMLLHSLPELERADKFVKRHS